VSSLSSPPSSTPAAEIDRDQLVDYLRALLKSDEGDDYCPNGLQVEGTRQVRRVVTGVSACMELFERARDAGADAILVHHGIFWNGASPVLTGMLGRRVRQLIRDDINLLAFHLPLDRHETFGNNALAATAFGLKEKQPFALHKGLPVGFQGRFETPIPIEALVDRCTHIYEQEPLTYPAGPAQIKTLGIVSGGAQRDFYQAIEAGLDAYITGEVSEWVMNVAREEGVHYLAAGHYATERLGVRALGEHLRDRFALEVEFIDVPNPA